LIAASVAAMQARAESIARSGPHAIGWPVRIAEQNREISCSPAERPRFALAPATDVAAAAEFAGLVSDASTAAPPGVRVTSTLVGRGLSSLPPSLKSNASLSLYMMSEPFVP